MTKFNLLRVSLILGLVALMLAVNSLNAQAYPTSDGELDSSFGGDGIVQTPIYAPTEGNAQAIVVQPDGKIVTGGSGGEDRSRADWLVSRFNADGTLDTAFGNRGHVLIDFPGFTNTINAVALLGDGKILAAGTAGQPDLGGTRATLMRFNSDGSVDDSFGIRGIIFEEDLADFTALLVQPDQRIVVGGTRHHDEDGSSDFAVVRLSPNGEKDKTFGNEGEAATSFALPHSNLNALVLLPNGSICAVGETSADYFGKDILAATLYTPSGALDTNFSEDGKLTIDLSSAAEYATAVLVDPSGNIVLGGVADKDFLLLRLTQTGQVDPKFGQGGVVRTPFDDASGSVQGLTLQDGKLLAAGSVQRFDSRGALIDSKMALVRYNSDGAIDTDFGAGFGINGKVTLYIYNLKSTGGNAVTTVADGDVIVAGTATTNCSNGNPRCEYTGVALAKITTEGLLARGFGTPDVRPGKTFYSPEISNGSVEGMIVRPDGKTVVVGNSAVRLSLYNPFVIRHNADGSLDDTFNQFGVFSTPLKSIAALVQQPDGKLVIVGNTSNSLIVLRLAADGRIDFNFGTGGYVTTALGGTNLNPAAIALQPDGKIVVAGDINNGGFVLVRFSADGVFDTSFGNSGNSGKAVDAINGGAAGAKDLIVAPDGKLIVAGYYCDMCSLGRQNTLMTRFTANGTIDTTFGTNGRVYSLLGAGWNMFGDLALQPDGKIVVAGTHSYDCDSFECLISQYSLARYNEDGAHDISFGDNGYMRFDSVRSYSIANAVSVAADGSIIVAGNTAPSNNVTPEILFVVRLHPDGSLDSAFAGGVLQVNMANVVKAQVLHPDGKVVVAADTPMEHGTELTLLRVQNSIGQNTATATPTLAATRTATATRTGTSTLTPAPTATSTLTSTPTSTPVAFSDVHPEDYFYAPVQYLTQHGIVSGYADNTFRPFNNTTRGQLTKIVVLGNGWTLENPATATFSDAPVGSPFFSFIETAVQHGIISGYADHTYRPNNNITRGQLSKVIVIGRGWILANPDQPTFSDVPSGNALFQFIETAVQHGIISGYDTGNGTRVFRPVADATRGQIAKIVYLSITQ